MNDNMGCGFITCRYNSFGMCVKEKYRKECSDVAKMILCLKNPEEEKDEE